MPKIKSIQCKEFKRFTDLTITDIPESARLVVLLGPNGCGKSSLFDAFSVWAQSFRGWSGQGTGYYDKGASATKGQHHPTNLPRIDFHIPIMGHANSNNPQALRAVYIRSAYRHEREFKAQLRSADNTILDDHKRPSLMASADERIFDNYQRLVSDSIQSIYSRIHDQSSVADIRDRLVGKIRQSMFRVFDHAVTLEGLGDPWIDGTFFFSKGTSKHYSYKNLSGGERAAFDLILDMVVKRETFDDTVFAIYEPDLHLHSAVHGKVLAELYALLPEDVPAKSNDTPPSEPKSSQLWIACHSAGMLKEAFEINQRSPGSVVFLDFNNRDFDQPIVMRPTQADRSLWKNALSVALDDMASLVAPREVILCEGSPAGKGVKNTAFDAQCLNIIFGAEFPDTLFVSVGNASDVESDRLALGQGLSAIVQGCEIKRLIDRDDLSSAEIGERQKNGISVLSRRTLEELFV